MTPAIKQTIDSRLQRIANVLLLNASFIDNLGLLNGKMGIAIFFYQYARYTGNEVYERYAGELIDEIYEEISLATPIDFANGLTGIGWGIEYLVHKGFVEADTDEALREIDNSVYQSFIWSPLSIQDQNSLFGFGFYCLARLKDSTSNDDNLETLKKKQLLIYLMDECERLLTKETLFSEVQVPRFTLYQLNSLAWFVLQTHKLGLFPVKSDKLIQHLAAYVETKVESNYGYIDSVIFTYLIKELKGFINNPILAEKYNAINTEISAKVSLYNESEEQVLNEYIKTGWNPVLFDLNLIIPMDLGEKAFSIANNEENWNLLLDKLNKNNMGLDRGMAGLGMALLNVAMSQYGNVTTTMNDHLMTEPNDYR